MDSLKQEVAHLSKHVIILRFLIDLPSDTNRSWIRELEDLIRARVELYRDVGVGFFYIKMTHPELTKRLLDLSPCCLSVGTTLLYQGCLCARP
jgi:hypothetical protein